MLVFIVGLFSIPVLMLLVEVVAALRPVKEKPVELSAPKAIGCVAVVVPAHNESNGIIPTLHDLFPQLGDRDTLLVIADNCTDDTAVVAAAAGAEVVVRNDPEKIGKGYAMARAISHLAKNAPDFVLFIDADCRVQSDLVEKLRMVCSSIRRPVQALDLMTSAENSEVNQKLSEFAWTIKNFARPLGLRILNRSVQLMGTGMIFPWELISAVPLATGHVAEDLKLGVELAAAGKPAHFFPFVKVTSHFPTTVKASETQRLRWIQGHLATMLRSVPRLATLAIKRRDLDLFVLALDLLIPPLSLLGVLTAGIFGLTILAALGGMGMLPLLLATANLVLLSAVIVLAWWKFGREILPLSKGPKVARSMLNKLEVYSRLIAGRTAGQWVRTDRSKMK
ncbi:MAG: glycosyltransferase family 2 protein [Bradyrhizobium sp.]|uniref:glycosyltransferase family 2 protein n=1 Tax=Bradyrhizobium sp. TaxID=376 RepID=UPI0025C0FA29|nr:glycosyltransferase family 2 protein [Bradyrhizobium sp.]MBI5263416.1 glycosyltransferase family 2 protein [Bradyrhizobium sp.]